MRAQWTVRSSYQREVIGVDPDNAEVWVVRVVFGHFLQDFKELKTIWGRQNETKLWVSVEWCGLVEVVVENQFAESSCTALPMEWKWVCCTRTLTLVALHYRTIVCDQFSPPASVTYSRPFTLLISLIVSTLVREQSGGDAQVCCRLQRVLCAQVICACQLWIEIHLYAQQKRNSLLNLIFTACLLSWV